MYDFKLLFFYRLRFIILNGLRSFVETKYFIEHYYSEDHIQIQI